MATGTACQCGMNGGTRRWGGQSYDYLFSENLDEVGWNKDNSGLRTHPVGQKRANGYGLYDMVGNVEELVVNESCGTAGYDGFFQLYTCGSSYRDDGHINYFGPGKSEWAWDEKLASGDRGFRIVCIEKGNPTVKDTKKKTKQKLVADTDMLDIPGKNFSMLKTEITQELYEAVMGENPSKNKGRNYPVENVSWYDAIMFCNCLSEMEGRLPVYALDGKTDTSKWNCTRECREGEFMMDGHITRNEKANGYRLPTVEEWLYAAKRESGRVELINGLDEDGWFESDKAHPVDHGKANEYGLYDMNRFEWCSRSDDTREYNIWVDPNLYFMGTDIEGYEIRHKDPAPYERLDQGFRIVRPSNN